MTDWPFPRFRVTRVIDGDTFAGDLDLGLATWRIGLHIRVRSYYAPEMREPGGLEAKADATSLLLGRDVALWSDERWSFDRLLCRVVLPDGTDFAERMVALGHGYIDA